MVYITFQGVIYKAKILSYTTDDRGFASPCMFYIPAIKETILVL